jgi:prepilin-type N-terminal cleavage/methylation domain-containing protein
VSRRGFTLLETLVALALTAIVLGALAGTVRRAAVARAQAMAAADRVGIARTVLLRLAAEVEAARAPAAAWDAFAVEMPARERPWSRLRLSTAAPVGLHALVYGVEADRRRPEVGILVRGDGPPGAPDPARHPLLEGVRAFRVRCFDGHTWQTACAGTLPRALEVGLAIEDGRGGVEELAVTVAPAAAG